MAETKVIEFDGYKVNKPSDDILDNADIFDLLDDLQNGGENNLKLIKLLKALLGTEEYAKMRDYFVKKDGKFSATKAAEFVGKLLESFDPKD